MIRYFPHPVRLFLNVPLASGVTFLFFFFWNQSTHAQTLVKHFRLDSPYLDVFTPPGGGSQVGFVGEAKDRFGKNKAAISLLGNGGFNPDDGADVSTLTATVWIKYNSLNPSDQYIVAENHCSGGMATYGFGLSQGQLYFTWGNGTTNAYLNTPAPSANQWHMITATYGNQQAKLYVDGNQAAVSPTSSINLQYDFAGKFTIGYGLDNCEPAYFFQGEVDDVKLYAGVMTAAQILAQYQEGGSAPDPVMTLSLNGNADAIPSSISTTHSGAIPDSDRFSQISGAMRFDGQNDVITVNQSFNNFKEVSIAAWIKLDGETTEPKAIVSSDNTNKFVHFQAASFPTEMSVFVVPAAEISLPVPAITPGQWVHLALSAKSGSQKIYINGAEVSADNATFTNIANTNLLRIGSGLLNGRFFKGLIDNVTVYDRALSQAQVKYDMSVSGRIAHYPLNNNANDVELGNHGTFSGGSFVPDRFGNQTGAYRTNGSGGKIIVPHSISYEWMEEFSFSFWFRSDHGAPVQYLKKGAGGFFPSDTSFTFLADHASATLSFGVGGQNVDFGSLGGPPAFFDVSDGVWHHMVGVYDRSRAHLYIDGNYFGESFEQVTFDYLNNNKQSIEFGIGNQSVDLDDIQLFRRKLLEPEVLALFNEVGYTIQTPTISASGDLSFCQGNSIILTSSSATGNVWSTGDTSQSIVVTASGNYSVRTQVGLCSSDMSDTVTVVVRPLPAKPLITVSGPLTFCQGGSVTLSTNAASGHRWSNGSTGSSITIASSGTFADTANVGGCQAVSDPVSVLVNPPPTVNAGADVAIQAGDSTILLATGATSYQWSPLTGINPSSGNTASVVARPTQTTMYTVLGTDGNQCSASDQVLVTVSGVSGSLQAPVISPATGTYDGPQMVTITTSNPGAKIYFTTSGNTPVVGTGFTKEYLAPFQVLQSTTVRAMVVQVGQANSPVSVSNITITNPGIVATPVISPGTGTYGPPQTITLSTTTAGAQIWYTTNGNTPVVGTGFTRLYSTPFVLPTSGTIKAMAIKSGSANSAVATAVITITSPVQTVATPVITPGTGIYAGDQTVNITCATPGATILYTTTGNVPVVGAGFTRTFSAPFVVNTTTTIRAMATAPGANNSAVAVAYITVGPGREAVTNSLDESSAEGAVRVFPNPSSSGRCQLEFSEALLEEVTFIVLSMDGRKLQEGKGFPGQTQTLDLSQEPTGLYQVLIQGAGRVRTLRLSKN